MLMPQYTRQLVTGGVMVVFLSTLAALGWNQDPDPFRREDAIAGRDTAYRRNVFMHWFTYRPRLERRREWNRNREGFFGTAGSINANRLYFYEEFQTQIHLNETLFAVFRHKADEDFDGEYARTLTGIGAVLNDEWTFSMLGDMTPEKGDIDISGEVAWRRGKDSRFRLALVAADALHDQKKVMEEYAQDPFTIFTEYLAVLQGDIECGAWVNWNSPLELHVGEGDLVFQYEQVNFGAHGLFPVGHTAHILAELGSESGSRLWREMGPSGIGTRELDRSHMNVNVEAEWDLTHTTRMWCGYRFFALRELYTDQQNPEGTGKIERNENMLHAGIKRRFGDRYFFWPGLYLNSIDLQDSFPADPDRLWDVESIEGKVALPLEIAFDNGATITLNISFRTDNLSSAGYNAQFYLPL